MLDQVPVVEVSVSPNVVVPLTVGTAVLAGVTTADVVIGELT